MDEVLKEALRRKARFSIQYQDYKDNEWSVFLVLDEKRLKEIITDFSVKKIRIEYEM